MLTIFGFVLAFDVIGLILVWPIYATPFLFVTVAGAITAASVIAWLQARFSWTWFTTTLLGLGGYLVLALPFTSPSSLKSPSDIGQGWISTIAGTVLSWKQLITIDLPVGTFQSLLVPAFLTFYVVNLVALAVAWRSRRLYWLPVIPLMLAPVFGIAFGYPDVSRSLSLFGVTIPVAGGIVGGVVTLALAVGYLSWGRQARRRESLASPTALPSDIRTGRGRRQRFRRLFTAIAVVALTAVVVGIAMTAAGIPSSRDVLRTSVNPDVRIREEVSPLSAYRKAFTDSKILATDLFSYSTESAAPANIRFAVMPYFNGEVFSVMPPESASDLMSSFGKVAADLPVPSGGNSDAYATEITVKDLSTMGDSLIWLPVPGFAKSVTFTGANARALTDDFYFNRGTYAGVAVNPSKEAVTTSVLTSGSTYEVSSFVESGLVDVAKLENPAAQSQFGDKVVPEKLTEWCEAQQGQLGACFRGMSGAEFGDLVEHLRARGYLSHGLDEPSAAEGQQTWVSQLAAEGYNFKPSLAGHSTGRIGDLFDELLTQQTVGGPNQSDATLVAAVGDDEQFAAAVALLADHVGFPSRVVVGFRATDSADGAYVVPACADATCTGGNLTAWVEIQGKDGSWAALDVTPQFVNPISPLSQDRQDPKNETQVVDENATVIPPVQSNPSSGKQKEDDNAGGINLGWLWEILRIGGLTLLIIAAVLSPFLLIIGSKVRRRRARREAEAPTAAVVGAWDELIDELVDAGYALPKTQTRRELAGDYDVASALALASLTDEAVFGPENPDAASLARSWEIVDRERSSRRAELTMWQRAKLELSLRSFLRYLGPTARPNTSVSSLTGEMAAHESGRISGFARFVSREARTGWAWLVKKSRTRFGRRP
jgi:hypothetical protein